MRSVFLTIQKETVTATRNQQAAVSLPTPINKRNYIVVPYTKGLSENLKRFCKKHGIQVCFNGRNHQRPDGIQRQRLYYQEEWHHIQIQMWQGGMQGGINRRVLKDTWNPLPQYMTILTPQVILIHWKTSV